MSQKKALQAICFARALAALVAELGMSAAQPEIVPAARLAAAERVLEFSLPPVDRAAARSAITEGLGQIRDRFLVAETGHPRRAQTS